MFFFGAQVFVVIFMFLYFDGMWTIRKVMVDERYSDSWRLDNLVTATCNVGFLLMGILIELVLIAGNFFVPDLPSVLP